MSITAIAGLSLAATGCGKSPSEFVAEKVIEQQTDGEVDVDFSDGGVAIETPDGDVSVGETSTKMKDIRAMGHCRDKEIAWSIDVSVQTEILCACG